LPKTCIVLALLGALLGCGPRLRLAPPPAVFPTTTSWLSQLDHALDGPLASDGARVFLTTRDGSLRAVDLATGTALWRVRNRAGALAARPGVLVVAAPDGTVWAVDPASGSARWKSASGVEGRLAPVFAGDRVLVLGKGLAALDLATGKLLWAVAEVTSAVAPALGADRLYVAAEAGVLRCHSLADGATIWVKKTGFPSLGVPLAVDGRVYLAAGERAFAAFDAKSGKRRWRWTVGAGARFEPAVLGGNVLFVTLEGLLYGLNKHNGHLSFRTSLPSRPASGPLLLGSAALVAAHGTRARESLLVTLDGRNGQRLGDLRTITELATSPVLIGRTLLLGLRDKDAVSALLLGAADQP